MNKTSFEQFKDRVAVVLRNVRDAAISSDKLRESCFDLCYQCEKILKTFKDFEFQPVKGHAKQT